MGKETNTILSNIPKNEHSREKKGIRGNCCQYCTNNPVFPTAILLNIHIAENHKNVAVKCNLCNDVFNKFMDYYSIRRHYLRIHKNDDMLDTCLQALKESTNMNGTNHTVPVESSSESDSVKIEDKISTPTPTPTEERKPGKPKTPNTPRLEVCVMCRSADISRRSNSMFCKTCICSVNADDTSAESPDGIKQDSGRPKRKFKCRLCKQLMNKDWVTITKHFEQNHQSDCNVESKTKSKVPKNRDSDGKKSDNSIPTNNNKERRIPIKDVSPSKSTNTKEILSSPTATYKCVHCDTSTDDRKVFRTHIAIHKDDPNSKQCPDCGECFVVNATCSLAKHLLKIHNVRNLKKYFIENDLFPKKKVLKIKTSEGSTDDHSEVSSSKSNPMRSFDTEHDEADNRSDFGARNEARSNQSELQDNENEKPTDVTGDVKKRRRIVKNVSPTKSKKIKNAQGSSSTKSNFKCVYCKVTTDNREEFQTHIISHKDGPGDRQCPECGECYAKAVCSLAKHILIAHDVRNLREYFMENNLLTPEELQFTRKRLNDN